MRSHYSINKLPAKNVLIVEDERFVCRLLQSILQDEYHITTASNEQECFSALGKQTVDLILLDIVLPKTDGYEVCKRIKKTELYAQIPIIFLTTESKVENEIKGFKLGAVDYLTKPVSPPLVKARVATQIALSKQQKSYKKLHYLANYDPLTQLPNRNLFNERLIYTFQLTKRNNSLFFLLLLDLDCFKQVNDLLGHHIGDWLLGQVGQRLSKLLRGADTVARLGGDEFAIILTGVQTKKDAALVARKVITELSRPFELKGQNIQIGASIGLTSYPDDGDDLDAMLKNADTAMYKAKAQGKNSYQFFST